MITFKVEVETVLSNPSWIQEPFLIAKHYVFSVSETPQEIIVISTNISKL